MTFNSSLQASHRRVTYPSHLTSYPLPKTNMKSIVSEKVTDLKFGNRSCTQPRTRGSIYNLGQYKMELSPISPKAVMKA